MKSFNISPLLRLSPYTPPLPPPRRCTSISAAAALSPQPSVLFYRALSRACWVFIIASACQFESPASCRSASLSVFSDGVLAAWQQVVEDGATTRAKKRRRRNMNITEQQLLCVDTAATETGHYPSTVYHYVVDTAANIKHSDSLAAQSPPVGGVGSTPDSPRPPPRPRGACLSARGRLFRFLRVTDETCHLFWVDGGQM